MHTPRKTLKNGKACAQMPHVSIESDGQIRGSPKHCNVKPGRDIGLLNTSSLLGAVCWGEKVISRHTQKLEERRRVPTQEVLVGK